MMIVLVIAIILAGFFFGLISMMNYQKIANNQKIKTLIRASIPNVPEYTPPKVLSTLTFYDKIKIFFLSLGGISILAAIYQLYRYPDC